MKTKILSEVQFGNYYKENSNDELSPIQWIVLKEKEDSVLLLSKNIIDSRPYNSIRRNIHWEKSSIREWLNNEFYSIAFNESEKQSLKSGTELNDFVFLLSDEEVEQYLAEESSRTALPTPFAKANGIYTNQVGESAWWLRSGVAEKNQTSYISSGGSFGSREHYVDETIIGIRPAIWVERSSLINDNQVDANINVKQILEQYDKDPTSRQPISYGDHIIATRIIRYIGIDSH